jgi:uncharacterized protein (TIGR03435 family)
MRKLASLLLLLPILQFASAQSSAPDVAPQTAPSPPPAFEVASIRLSPPGINRMTKVSDSSALMFTATNMPLPYLIEMAYGVSFDQLAGAPVWFNDQLYDISAKPEGNVALTEKQLQPLLQQLLQDRFHLVVHREMRDLDGYALVVAKDGPKLQTSKQGVADSGHGMIYSGEIRAPGFSMGAFTTPLSMVTHRHVIDQTGISGTYDITLKFAPEESTDSTMPFIYTALQEQLGLKLVSQKVPVKMLVIDHVDRLPTEN